MVFSDIDLSQTPDMTLRNYPTPPTGHDLMAMFPARSPDISEKRPGPTSDFFKRQERAFFAQAGKEIVRVRVEVDFPHGSELDVKQRPASRPWPLNGPGPGQGPSSSTAAPHHSPGQPPPAPLLYPHRPRVSVPVNPGPSPMFQPLSSHTPTSNQLPSNLHPPPPVHQTTSGLRTPPEDTTPQNPNSKPEYTEEYEPDESWRRPMPYAERRRAGKHTRRVIVRT